MASFLSNLWLKLKSYKNEILIGGSGAIIACASCFAIYKYFSYQSEKIKEEKEESPRYTVIMTPELEDDLFIMGKIRLERNTAKFSPENILRIERILIKHVNLDNYTRKNLQSATGQRLKILKQGKD